MEADASGSRRKKKQQKLGGGDCREGRVRFVPPQAFHLQRG